MIHVMLLFLWPQYDTQDIAVATRARVHGVKWPTTNPKYLSVDYLSSGEVARVTDGQLVIQEEEDKGQYTGAKVKV